MRKILEAERVAEERAATVSRDARFDGVTPAAPRGTLDRWWARIVEAQDRRRAAARRRDAARGRFAGAQADRAFLHYQKTVEECRRTVQLVRLEREKALFFAAVSVTAPWKVRAAALVRAQRFGRHLAELLASWDRLLRAVEWHEATRRAIRKELHLAMREEAAREGWVTPTTALSSGSLREFDNTGIAVSRAFGRAEDAVRAATAEVRAARSFVSGALLRKYLWRNSSSILHRQVGIRAVFTAMPSAERMSWLQEVHSCLTETSPETRSRVAAGFVLAAPRTIMTAWAMTRRRAGVAVAAEEGR